MQKFHSPDKNLKSNNILEKLSRKQTDLNVKIKELELLIEKSPRPSYHKHQVTTSSSNERLSRAQMAQLRFKTFKNFITFLFALLLFLAVVYLLYIAL